MDTCEILVSIGVTLGTWFIVIWVPTLIASHRFCGTWELYNIQDRELKRVEGPITIISHGHGWNWIKPQLLTYRGIDPPDKNAPAGTNSRELRGTIILDEPAYNRASGVIHYVGEPGAEFDCRELHMPNLNRIYVTTGNREAYPHHVYIRRGHTPESTQ